MSPVFGQEVSMATVRAWVGGLAASLLGLALSGCSSAHDSMRPPPTHGPAVPSYAMTAPDAMPKPPYPDDPDPCAAYCLCWVPPTCRDVPRLVCCCPEQCRTEKVFRHRGR